MKKKERYKILNYAKKQYSGEFHRDYQFQHLSKNELLKLLKEHDYSDMCEWSYCCYGMYQNCWQDPYEEGIDGFTQERVNDIIADIIKETAKICRKDKRILCCEHDNGAIDVIIVARDIMYCDYLITFKNREKSQIEYYSRIKSEG